ncbi:hypothetical protein PHYBOEH_002694 [Phytophthora boehmeriae]|uniref:Methyltransferase domain-containing protein n=1 Tax=Phytophthora boehmeriae TaxID=109152 RepID=A0A8T1X5V8_9STRA|nr:hypothetical protein PHYBOEH_002694 [Phytophthora boehmeriae]
MGRGKHWQDVENRALARAWLTMSDESPADADQNPAKIWEKISELFAAACPSSNRSAKALESHWSTLQKELSKFSSLYDDIASSSGSADFENIKQAALVAYHTDCGSAFNHLGCWEILHQAQKWSSRPSQTQGTGGNQGEKRGQSSSSSGIKKAKIEHEPSPNRPQELKHNPHQVQVARPVATASENDVSWSRNLERRGGFWGNAYWYDLQLERRMPQAKAMLEELVLALPPCDGKQVLDLCAGSGRASAALLAAYPTAKLTLLDSSEQRLGLAKQRLDALAGGFGVKFDARAVEPTQTTELSTEPVDVVIACLAFHVLTEKPAHYALSSVSSTAVESQVLSVEDKYELLFRATWRSLRPGGHIVFADHVGQMSLFKQLEILQRAGFEDVDCAWRKEDSFVAGGRKPPKEADIA